MSNLEQFRENFTGSQSQRERSQHITEKDARDELGISYLLALSRDLVLSVAREKAPREAAEVEASATFKAAIPELLEEDEPESVAELWPRWRLRKLATEPWCAFSRKRRSPQ